MFSEENEYMGVFDMKSLFLLTIYIGLLGCLSNPNVEDLTTEQRARVANIEVFSSSVDNPHEVLGTINGISCSKDKSDKYSVNEEEAINGLKLRAAQMYADAVINTLCQHNPNTDWGKNCWSSIQCVGDAISYK